MLGFGKSGRIGKFYNIKKTSLIMNKRGWVRIIEACFAVLIVFGVLFFIFAGSVESSEPDLSQMARDVLEEISRNTTLRQAVLSNGKSVINPAVQNLIKSSELEFEVKICEPNEVCGKSSYTKGNVYSGERMISSAVKEGQLNPKRVRLFIWRKGA